MAVYFADSLLRFVHRAGTERSTGRVLAEMSCFIGKHLSAHRVTVYLLDEERLVPFVSEFSSGTTDAARFARWHGRESLELSTMADRFRNGEDVILMRNPEDFLPSSLVEAFELQPMLAVALRTSGKLLGVLLVEGDPDELEEQQPDVSEFAGFMALAIENADALEREQQRAREAEVLLEVGTVLTETTELKKVLASVARNSARVTGFERCSIFVIDDSGNLTPTMSQFADGHADEEAWRKFRSIRAELPAAIAVMESGLPVAYEEPETIPEMIPSVWLAPFGIKSELYVPLTAWNQCFGVLLLDHRERRPITSQQIKMAQAVAAHGSVAIGMARLLEREKESRRALTASEERFRTAFDHAPIAIGLADLGGRFFQVNSAACDMFGYTQEQLLSLSLVDITHPADMEQNHRVVRELINGPAESITVEKRYVRSDGGIVSGLLNISVIRDLEGSPLYLLGQVVDLTDLKRSHRRLEELVRSKDEFLASVSHELRTPLTAVLGFAELLQQEHSSLSASERDEMIQVIVHQASDLNSIVEDVLVAARAERGTLRLSTVPVDLRAQVSQVLETYDPGIIDRIRVVGESRRGAGDPARVRQILRNMISNALRYGGDDIRINLHTGKASVGVSVSDNGSGIPRAERKLVFEAYHRAHDAPGIPGSMGLGLSVSRQLARLMGGDLTYRYHNGRSVFELSLPAAGKNTKPPDTSEAN